MKDSWIIFFVLANLGAQVSYTISNELKYGDGKKITNLGSAIPTESDYNYFENLLDINTTLNNNLSIYSQFEISNPPIFGPSANRINAGSLEFINDNLMVTFGNIYTVYGRGLMVNTYQVQNVDFDNSLFGVNIEYQLRPDIFLFGIKGKNTFNFRSNPAFELSDLYTENELDFIGFDYSPDFLWGEISYSYSEKQTALTKPIIQLISGMDTKIGHDLTNRVSEYSDDNLTTRMHDIRYEGIIGPFDLYLENVSSIYSKILGDNENGSLKYGSISTYLLGLGLTYEYKNYDQQYFLYSNENPPIVFRESSLPLIAREAKSINYNDEIGHQLELTTTLPSEINLLTNISVANRHHGYRNDITRTISLDTVFPDTDEIPFSELQENIDNLSNNVELIESTSEDEVKERNISLNDFSSFDIQGDFLSFYPYQQMYLELNGYLFDGNLFYNIGVDQMKEVIKYHPQQQYSNDYDADLLSSNISTVYDSWKDAISDPFEEFYSGLWQDSYDACEAYPDFTCEDQGPEDYANEQFVNTYGFVLADSISALQNYVNSISDEKISELLEPKASSSTSYQYKNVFTLPTQFAYKFAGGHSVTIYWEHQWKEWIENWNVTYSDFVDNSLTKQENIYNRYTTMSYRNPKKWSFTLFFDYEHRTSRLGGEVWSKTDNDWIGIDITMDLGEHHQASVFYGSQKGGRICANGICADQPAFEDGLKFSIRSIF